MGLSENNLRVLYHKAESGRTWVMPILSVLPTSIVNDKGTKFFITMRYSAKGWQVSYVYTGARAVVRKGYPVQIADTLPEALEAMLTWFNDNHPDQLNWD